MRNDAGLIAPSQVVASRHRWLPLAILPVLLLGSFACHERMVMERRSPDGQVTAVVTDRQVLDGPAHVLYLQGPGGERHRLLRLGEDTEACTGIVWSSDGRWVCFLSRVSDGFNVRVYDARSRAEVRSASLLLGHDVRVENVHLGVDGQVVSYKECQPPTTCVDRQIRPARVYGW